MLKIDEEKKNKILWLAGKIKELSVYDPKRLKMEKSLEDIKECADNIGELVS